MASPHLLSVRVAAGCPQAAGQGPACHRWDGICVYQPWTGQLVVRPKQQDREARSWCVSLQHRAPQTPKALPPQFSCQGSSQTATTNPSVRRDTGVPPPLHIWVSSGLLTLGYPRTHQFCRSSSGTSGGGCFRLISKRNVYVTGGWKGGEEKHHSSVLGKGKSY